MTKTGGIRSNPLLENGRMKEMKKTNRIIMAAILLTLALLAGCGKPAAPIDLPSDDAVAAVGMITMSGEDIYFTDPGRIKAAMDILRAAEPTRRQSVNDSPSNVASYGIVSIYVGDRTTVVYYYEKDGKHYIEQPYRGIYRTADNLEDLLFQPD